MPREVFALADTLQVLDLSGNRIDHLPDDLPRLHRLRILFCSENRFTRLPAVLGRCSALEMIGFKANRIELIEEGALPPRLRWLILTDNRLAELPAAIGSCAALQKLMLAGNRLARVPIEVGRCSRLELVRLSANAFPTIAAALPDALLSLPRLSWLAHGGNPFSEARERCAAQAAAVDLIEWRDLDIGPVLGEGASGTIVQASWRPFGGPVQSVAVKLFKGAMTSDGLPDSEIAAMLAAGSHRNLVGIKGRLSGHPEDVQGLVLDLVAPSYKVLAGPPSLDSCSRDVYPDSVGLCSEVAFRIGSGIQAAVRELHRRGVMHGDIYAHNLLVDPAGHALLGDFGAASMLPLDDPLRRDALQRIEERALSILLGELAAHCDDPAGAKR